MNPRGFQSTDLKVIGGNETRIDEKRNIGQRGANAGFGLGAKPGFMISRASKTVSRSQVEILASVA